ncbi:MAG: hypothetical protein J3Q66DRAFT_439099 [Benniella sp.]|nr:MAG: hypothetical protein J3Q66DRAFT_439099 [Benniella sp.]
MAAHEHLAQSFRVESSTNITSIPARLDNKSGQHIILWRDIQHVFADAKTVFNNGKAVLFLTDDNFEYLTPLRIAYYPGVVLKVVGPNTSSSTLEVAEEESVVSTEISSQEPTAQDCVSPPLAGKSLHMELSTLSLPEITEGSHDHSKAPYTVTSTDIELVLHSEDQSDDSNIGSTTEADSTYQMASTNSAIVEAPEGSEDCVEASQMVTAIEPLLHQENSVESSKSNNPSTAGEMLVIHSGSMTIYTHPSAQAYHHLYNSFVEAMNAGRDDQATAIERAMNELFEKLEVEMAKVRDIKKQVAEARRTRNEATVVQPPMAEEGYQATIHLEQQYPAERQQEEQEQQTNRVQVMGERQEQEMKDNAPDPLPGIHDQILSSITLNYELHEYPYPRLFVVLPKVLDSKKIYKLAPGQFRLYFLCECGAHTMPEGCTTPHQVHMANHQGYDIAKPAEFFQKYGWYVLMQMHMVKNGVNASGLLVPPLASSKIVEGLDTTKENLDHVSKNIEALVDDTMEFLLDLTGGWDEDAITDRKSIRLDKMEVMEEGERRPLKWYLKRDADPGFGNLYRMVTRRGYVKWACKEHCAFDSTLTAQAYNLHSGEYFREDLREIVLQRGYSTTSEFYSGGTCVCKVLKLVLSGSPYYFTVNVAGANAVDMALDGISQISNQYEYDPIIKLMSNGRIQSLRLLSPDDLNFAVSIDSIIKAPKMRVLELQMPFDAENETGMSYLGRILACCPNLVYLGLRLKEQVSLVKVITISIPKLKKLEHLELYYGPFYTAADISRTNITGIQMSLPFTKHQIFKDRKIPAYSQGLDEPLALDQLLEILCESPTVEDIVVGYQDLEPMDTINIVSSRLKTPSYDGGLSLRRLELVSIRDRLHTPSTRISMAFTQTGVETEVRISQWEDTDSAVYANFFQSYGATVRVLEITNRTFDDGFARLLDKSTKDNGSDFTSLGLDVRSLSLVGLGCIDRAINRSKDLERLELHCTTSSTQTEQENARRFLKMHGKKLTGLNVQAHSLDALAAWIENVCPSRGVLSSLVDLQLTLPKSLTLQYLHPYVQWLAEMVSAQPNRSLSIPSSSEVDGPPTECPDDSSNGTETSLLKRLYLNDIKLKQDEWARILAAIDFSALEELNLKGTNFSQADVDSLVKGIGGVDLMAPLKLVDLSGTSLSQRKTATGMARFEVLREKAPSIMITGLEHLGVF